jgi:hypothetical protein
MRKWMLFLLMGLLIVPLASAQDGSERLSLTIYNQGTALVQDVRSFELSEGANTIDFTDVAASIDATSVVLNALTDPDGMTVLEQNFVFDLVDSSALLNRYLDEVIQITVDDGTTFSGQLLSGRNGEIILRNDAGQVFVIGLSKVRDIQFPNLPDGLITRPTLRWLLESAAAGTQQVELTYLTGGISWTADYNVLLNTGNTALDLNGWVTLTNTSGAGYADAQVKLVAGDVNRLPVEEAVFRGEMDLMLAQPTAAPAVEQREFFEYQLYEINRPVTVADNETKQVEFVTGTDVPAHTYYVYNSFPGFYGYYGPITDQGYGMTGITDVQNWLEFSTGEENGLGADLPAGRIRVYQEDVDGAALLIGENRIDHTPMGEDVTIYLGNAFDLVGERTQTNFQFIADNVLEETYEIKLRNRKDDQAVEIRVPESLFRWSNWEILSSSDEYTKIDSATIEFRVMVEPGEERVITYTVRYSWPR